MKKMMNKKLFFISMLLGLITNSYAEEIFAWETGSFKITDNLRTKNFCSFQPDKGFMYAMQIFIRNKNKKFTPINEEDLGKFVESNRFLRFFEEQRPFLTVREDNPFLCGFTQALLEEVGWEILESKVRRLNEED